MAGPTKKNKNKTEKKHKRLANKMPQQIKK